MPLPFIFSRADMEKEDQLTAALDDLIGLAAPPAKLLPTLYLCQCIAARLAAWKQDVLDFVHQTVRERDRHEFINRLRGYHEWLKWGVNTRRALHHDVYIALMASRFRDFGGPVNYARVREAELRHCGSTCNFTTSTHHAVGDSGNPGEQCECKTLERRYLEEAFRRAALVASGVDQAVAGGVELSQLELRDQELAAWASEGTAAVEHVLDEQPDADWIYGMLELLERLTLACDGIVAAHNRPARARRDLLLRRWPLIELLRRCPHDWRGSKAGQAYSLFTLEVPFFEPGLLPDLVQSERGRQPRPVHPQQQRPLKGLRRATSLLSRASSTIKPFGSHTAPSSRAPSRAASRSEDRVFGQLPAPSYSQSLGRLPAMGVQMMPRMRRRYGFE